MTKISLVLVLVLVVAASATALTSPIGGFLGDPNGAIAPAPGPSGKSVLIYGPSLGPLVAPLWNYNEETITTALGHGATVVGPQTWMGLTAADFGAFDAIVFGDPKCEIANTGTVLLEPANVSKAAWSSVIDGPMIVVGTTPQFSQFSPSLEDRELIANGIDFAASGPGTGLYVSLSCWYLMAPSNTPVDFLSEVGDFQVGGREGCTGAVTIVDPVHPAMAGLTTLGEPDWGCASQELITAFPASFDVLATAIRPSDGADLPFIVATPFEATNDPPVDPPIDPPVELGDDPIFAEFWAEIEIEDDEVEVEGGFRLGEGNDGIDPVNEVVTIEIGAYSFTISVGSFELDDDDDEWESEGVIDGVEVEMEIERVGDETFEFEFEIEDADLDGLEIPVLIWLAIGNDSGETLATGEHEDDEDDAKDEDDEDDDHDDDDEHEDGDEEDEDDEDEDDEDEEDDD